MSTRPSTTVSPGASSYKVDTQIRFKSDNNIIIQVEQLILQTMLGGNDNTNSSIGDPEFCRPAWKNTRLQSPPRQMANKPYDKLSHLDYKLHDVVTEVAELLDGLASQTGDSQGRMLGDNVLADAATTISSDKPDKGRGFL
jgi:hypothetical protein